MTKAQMNSEFWAIIDHNFEPWEIAHYVQLWKSLAVRLGVET